MPKTNKPHNIKNKSNSAREKETPKQSKQKQSISDSNASTVLKSEIIKTSDPGVSVKFRKDAIIAERYRLEELIGEGGMGQVWKAYDAKLDRTVALKRLGLKMKTSEESYLRFIREAKVLSKLNHPHICSIYDLIEDCGENYISMEYIPGASLAEGIKNAGLSKSEKIDIALGVAEALSTAHGKGIVHRDLKPSNIMIQGAKILDFGLAKQKPEINGFIPGKNEIAHSIKKDKKKGTFIYQINTDSSPQSKTSSSVKELSASDNITTFGTFLGTIKYMSPEQARGEEIDFRSDIFSFGTILYEMFSGKYPFEGSGTAFIYSIQTYHPKPMVKLRTGCPVKLARFIDRAMQKDKDKRPTAQEFVLKLNAYKSKLFKKPYQAVAAAMLAISVIGLFVWQFVIRANTQETYSIALLKSVNLTGDPSYNWISNALTDSIRTTLQGSPRIDPVGSQKLYSFEKQTGISSAKNLKREDIIKASSFLGAEYICASRLKKQNNEYLFTVTLYNREGEKIDDVDIKTVKPELFQLSRSATDAVLKMFDAGDSKIILEDIYSKNQIANKEFFEGSTLLAKDQPIASRQHFLNALSYDPTFAMALLRLAEAWKVSGYHSRAVENLAKALLYQERLPLYERAIARGDLALLIGMPEKTLEIRNGLLEARPMDLSVNIAVADSYLELRQNNKAREIIESLLKNRPNDPYILSQLGVYYSQEGDHEKGVNTFQKSFDRYIAIGNIEQAVNTANEISWLMIMLGKYKEAEAMIRKTIFLAKQIGSIRDEAKAWSRLGSIAETEGDIKDAQSYAWRAFNLSQKIDDLKGQADALIDIAFYKQAKGDFIASEQLLIQSLELWNRMADKQGQLKVMYYLGWIYYNRGDFMKAKEMFTEAVELAVEIGNKQNLTGTNGGLGSTYTALGDIKAANDHFQKQLYFGKVTKDEQAQSTAYINLAISELFNRKYDQARKYNMEAEKIVRSSGDTWTLGTVLTLSGWIEVSGGRDFKTATRALAEAIPILEKNQNNSWLSLARVCSWVAKTYIGDSDAASALNEIDKAIEFCRLKGRTMHLVEEYKIKCDFAINNGLRTVASQVCRSGLKLARKHKMEFHTEYFSKILTTPK
jgi:serine/threonine protein kinase/Tfp pilus assembly protein PilF